MQPIYVNKTLSAASSNGLGSISTAATSVVTLNTSTLDTGRRVVFYSTADMSTMTFSVTGTGEARNAPFTETVVGSTASGIAATTTSDFIKLSSVSISSNANIPILIGTSTMGGTPWHLTNWHCVGQMSIGAALVFSTSANGMSAKIDLTLTDPTQTYIGGTFNGAVPVFNSTSHTSVGTSTNTWGIINADVNAPVPVAAWRLTIASSATGAGSVAATVIQAGI